MTHPKKRVKQYSRCACACLLLLFVAAPGRSGQSAEDLPVLEAVLRYEIDAFQRESSTNSVGGVAPFSFCVQIRATAQAEPADPDASLLARFTGHRPPVKPGSACVVKDWMVYDRSSGKGAVILDVGPVVRRRHASEAEVSGAPYVGGQMAREYLYRLKLKGRTWTVSDVRLKIVT